MREDRLEPMGRDMKVLKPARAGKFEWAIMYPQDLYKETNIFIRQIAKA